MQNSKRILVITAVVGLALFLGLGSTAVLAAEEGSNTTFVAVLAEKLGLSEESVETALEDAKAEVREEFQAEREAEIQAAVDSGELTSEQKEILDAMHEIREERREENREAGERPNREGSKEDREAEMIEMLQEKGVDVTAEELQELRETMQELDLGGRPHGRGMGHGRGQK